MLFQPTNISPSSFAGVGGDLVDATEGLTISWQVNGTSPLYGWRVAIYANDSESTFLYTTIKEDVEPPFYGTDGMGNPQRFTVTIPAETLAEHNIVNGSANGYKYKIHQWWGPGSTQVTRQVSENYFICQAAPTVSITTDAITAPNTPITGTWSQEDGVGMDWVRWTVARSSDKSTILLDSGIIHTQVLNFAYNGWTYSANDDYYVTLYYQLQNGYQGSVSKEIETVFGFLPTRGNGTAELLAGCADVHVEYHVPGYMTLTDAGSAVATNGWMEVRGPNPATWTGKIYGGAEGYLVWCGNPQRTVNITLTGQLGDDSGYWQTMEATVYQSGSVDVTFSDYSEDERAPVTTTLDTGDNFLQKIVTLIFGGDTWYIVVNNLYGTDMTVLVNTTPFMPGITAQMNGQSLDTSATSVTINGQPFQISSAAGVTVYPFSSPLNGIPLRIGQDADVNTVLTISGIQRCFYFGFIQGEPSDELMETMQSGAYAPLDFTPEWVFLSDFSSSAAMQNLGSILPADGMDMDSLSVSGFGLYRRQTASQTAFASIDQAVYFDADGSYPRGLIDFGAGTGEPVTYSAVYLLTDGTNTVQAGFVTNVITPCCWDWILTTAQEDDNGFYHMTGEYRFGLDLGTEAISNNNVPSLLQNFTKYPTRQGVTANYRTGTLTAFIGTVDRENNVYIDTAAQSEAIMAISENADTKFLRTRKGEMWMVDTAGATTMRIGDKYREQPYKATLTWAETGSADGVSVISIPTDAAWPL